MINYKKEIFVDASIKKTVRASDKDAQYDEKAKKLLLSTSCSSAEVAEQSGYGDYRVFTKVFKKTEGITPSQYRRDFLDEKIHYS